jgi:hypothetical protein
MHARTAYLVIVIENNENLCVLLFRVNKQKGKNGYGYGLLEFCNFHVDLPYMFMFNKIQEQCFNCMYAIKIGKAITVTDRGGP